MADISWENIAIMANMDDENCYDKISKAAKEDNQSTEAPSSHCSDDDGNCTSDDDKFIKGLSVKTRKGRAIVSFDLKNVIMRRRLGLIRFFIANQRTLIEAWREPLTKR